MKKLTFLLTLMIATGVAKGQSVVTEFNYGNGKYFNFHNIVETSDNCLIVACPMFEACGTSSDIGEMFYKVSIEGMVMDSLLIEKEDNNLRVFFERDPNNPDNYLYAYFDMMSDSVTLRMYYLDNMLNITTTNDIVFDHIEQDYYSHDYFIDPCGDIIASYSVGADSLFKVVFVRIGFDGMVKHTKEVPEIIDFDQLQIRHSGMFSNTDLLYCYWGHNRNSNMTNNPPIRAYVLDSLFNVVDEHGYYKYDGEFYGTGWNEHFAPFGDDYYLLTTRYNKLDFNTYYTHHWVLLVKFDRNHQLQKGCLLGESISGNPCPIRIEAVDENTIYYSYMIFEGYHTDLVLACMDGDLNILWKRCIEYDDGAYWGQSMRVLENGDIAVGAFRYGINPGIISVVVIKDEYDRLEEHGIIIRPYTYYPNPAQDELRLYFSPDVSPTQIDLYDLQGRLVKTQRNGLESLNLQGIAAGTYTMRVTLEGGKAFSDKVVKE